VTAGHFPRAPSAKMRALTRAVGVILTFGSSFSCSSSSQSVTAPSISKCQVTAVAEPATFGASGGAGTLTVNTNRECQWNAASSGNWIQLGAQPSGQGNGQVAFSVTTNPDPSQRRGAITISDQQVAITQDAAPCIFTVSPLNDSVSPAGERRTINVTANGPQCSWSARSETEWLAIVQGSEGSGSGQVVYEARMTTGPSRSGELTIAGQRVMVTQGVGCIIGIAPTSQTVSAGGGSGAISVTTAAGCPWSAQSETAWISITSATSGTGAATVTFSVGAWDGPQRTGTLRVGPQVFTVRQNSGCRFTISPESYSVTSAGGSGAVAVTTAAGCEWTATSNAPWIPITTGGTGSGNGTVQFSVAPTTGPARSGTLTIAGRPFAVSQSSGCTFSISPTAWTFPSSGGPGSVAVSTSAGCAWTATASVSWVRITSGQSGTGAGTVAFTVDGTHSSQPRSATLSIAGQAFTITQDGAPCLYVLSPPSVVLEAGGGSGIFEVNTPEGCTWTAVSNDAWLHVTAGPSGSGDGTVSFSADANPGSARTGTIVAGGRTFTASQAAAGAMLSLDLPPNVTRVEVPQLVTSSGNEFRFEIIARATRGNSKAIESCFRLF
jgi:Putative binding domain, N-terminal/Viral BACON domain